MSAAFLGYLALALMAVAGTVWIRAMFTLRAEERRTPALLAAASAIACGLLAFSRGPGTAGGIAAGVAVALGCVFVLSRLSGRQARRTPHVAVGGPILDFSALDADGKPFALSSLKGRPFLLKFFRGHWCPYCVAELRRWEELRPELDARGIAIVTVSAETPEKLRAGRGKHGLAATLLADPDLAVTKQYGLVNWKGLSPGGLAHLPIPTAILVDAEGVVRWIDQAADYQVRSHPDRVLAAIRRL